MHKLLYSLTDFPEFAGQYRTQEAMILDGSVQPLPFTDIIDEMFHLESEIQSILDSLEYLDIIQFIDKVCRIHHKLTQIHPFDDGNGRVSRALMNFLFYKREIPIVYFLETQREQYLNSLRVLDNTGDVTMLRCLVMESMFKTLKEMQEKW